MEYHFKVHKEKNGFWAECLELSGCLSQGDSLDDLKASAKEALNLYLSENLESKVIFPLPKSHVGKNTIAIEVDPGVALALLVRQARLNRNMTQTQMKEVLGIKTLSNYQRLEDPKRANPELRTLISIVKILPEIKFGALLDSYKPSKKKAG